MRTSFFSNSKKESILNSFNFGVVANFTENRPTSGANYANSVPWREQLDLIQNMGGNTVRLGVNTTSSGSADKPNYANYDTLLKQVFPEIVSRNMLCIILFIDQADSFMGTTWQSNSIDMTEDLETVEANVPTYYQAGYDKIQGFLNIYGSYGINDNPNNFILECGNEPELFRGIQLQGTSGGDISHFWPKKLLCYKSNYKGTYEGAKALLPNLRIATPASAGWAPAAMWTQLIAETPDVDIVAWHWYDEQERNMTRGSWPAGANGNAGSTYTNIANWIWNRYNKPCIITECNARGIGFKGETIDYTESDPKHQDRAIAFFGSFIPKLVAESDHVIAITMFRLFSEPYLSTPDERSYGVYYYTGKDTSQDPSAQDWSDYIPKKTVEYVKWITR